MSPFALFSGLMMLFIVAFAVYIIVLWFNRFNQKGKKKEKFSCSPGYQYVDGECK